MTTHYVYIFAECTGIDGEGFPEVSPYVKIGVSRDIPARMQALQTGNSRELLLVGCDAFQSRAHSNRVEAAVHRILSSQRVLGEWFAASSEEAAQAISRAANPRPVLRVVK